jgi:hypothetical protein
MASEAFTAKHDLANVPNMPSFHQVGGNRDFEAAFSDAKELALKWLDKVEPLAREIDDLTLQPLVIFVERIASLVDHAELKPGETFAIAMRRLIAEVRPGLFALKLEVLEASGLLGRWQEDFPSKRDAALQEIGDTAAEASAEIRKKAADAVAEFEAAKAMSNKISGGTLKPSSARQR